MNLLNVCPNCHQDSYFIPEQMPCDGSLVLWCSKCGNFISQTITLKTIANWWAKYDKGEDSTMPTVTKEELAQLYKVQETLQKMLGCVVESPEMHIKDFNHYVQVGGIDNGN